MTWAIRRDQRRSEAIRGHQRPSEIIRGHQRSSVHLLLLIRHQRSSEVIRDHQRSSEVISPPPPAHPSSEVIRGHQRSSEVIRDHQSTCGRPDEVGLLELGRAVTQVSAREIQCAQGPVGQQCRDDLRRNQAQSDEVRRSQAQSGAVRRNPREPILRSPLRRPPSRDCYALMSSSSSRQGPAGPVAAPSRMRAQAGCAIGRET